MHAEVQRIQNSKAILKRKKNTSLNSKAYYEATIIKTVDNGQEIDIYINEMEQSSEKHLLLYLLHFNRVVKSIQLVKKRLFNKSCCINWISIQKQVNNDPYLTPYAKIYCK